MKATRRNLGTAKAVVGRESIPLADLRVSGVRRLAEVEPDADYIKRLLASIEEVGLIHALTLIAANGTYEVIAGAHRLHALRRLRGKDGVLAPGEYRALPPDTPAEELLAISIKENADRTASAPVAEARHFARLVKEKRVSQAKLAKLNSTNRAWVGAALQLAERFDDLPECWRQDLSTPPDRKGDGPSITMTHWAETAPKLPPPPLAPQVIDDMVKAHQALVGQTDGEQGRVHDWHLPRPVPSAPGRRRAGPRRGCPRRSARGRVGRRPWRARIRRHLGPPGYRQGPVPGGSEAGAAYCVRAALCR